ncbi:MAG: hypothetical protein ACAI25_17935, partial [Planctomycetota bacterium]
PLEEKPLVTWRVKVVIATHTKATWKDASGTTHSLEASMSGREEEAIAASLAAWRSNVVAATRGRVEVQTDIETTAEAVRRLAPKDRFACKAADFPHSPASLAGRFDALLTYVYLGDSFDSAHGSYVETFGEHSVAYGSIAFTKGELLLGAGVLELDVFINQARSRLTRVQGWPPAFVPQLGRHRTVSGPGCFEDPPGSPGHVALAKHIVGEHVTDAMWRSLVAPRPVPNAWNAGDVHDWRLAGPFRWRGEPGTGLEGFEKREELLVWSRDNPKTKLVESADLALAIDRELPGDPDHQLAVAQTWVHVPRALRATLVLGSDDGCRVRVGGKVVHRYPRDRAFTLDDESIPVDLEAGWNSIHVTVENTLQVWRLSLRVRDADGSPIAGVKVAADRP